MIPNHIISAINEGIEQDDIEFKSVLKLATKEDRAKVARSISAMANTVIDIGYYIVGVIDKKDRGPNISDNYIVNFTNSEIDDISIGIEKNCLDYFLNARPNIDISLEFFPETQKRILLVLVKGPFKRPYYFKKETTGIREGQAFVRIGASCEEASANDFVNMVLPGNNNNDNITDVIQSYIDEKERKLYIIDKDIESSKINSNIKVQYKLRRDELLHEKKYLEELIYHIKSKLRFSTEVRGLKGNSLHRLFIRRIEELISKIETISDIYPDIRSKVGDEALDLCFQAMRVDGNHSRLHYNLSRLYEILKDLDQKNEIDNIRRAFDSSSRSVDIAPDFPDVRILRMRVSKLIIDRQDGLYIDAANDALQEDEIYFRRKK